MRLTCLLLLLFSTHARAADNWPQWRGPTADGVAASSANPPLAWDGATGKNVKWTAKLTGKGSSTPVVWGDKIFVMAAEKTDRIATPEELPKQDPNLEKMTTPPTNFYKFWVTAYDVSTGKELWKKLAAERVPHEGHHPSHSYCAGSPTTDGERLYCSFGSFGTYCYDLAGNLLWKKDLGLIHSRLGWGEAVSPVVHAGRLVLNWDQEVKSALYCLDVKTGETIWKTDRDEKTTWNTPLVTEFRGTTQVIVNGIMHVCSYDLATGRLIWSGPGTTANPIPSPLRVGDTVVCTGGYKGSVAMALPLAATGTAIRPVWKYSKGTPYVPSPVLVNDRLYFTNQLGNQLTVLDAKTGKVVLDRERLTGVNAFYASPVFAGGHVYLTSREGTTLVLKPGETLHVLATNRISDPIDASPVAVGNRLFLRGEKLLYCLEE
ncbi:MAG TPA: PQQ-binding-like beta-propeller repeat protein [Fimbriiglobus sp.]|jgi:outer membrane protein assembly factor BamB